MPKTPSQFAEIRDERRNKILFAALRLFALNGYDSITINDITTEANCSHGLFYHYFKTKIDLWDSLIEEASKRISPFFEYHKANEESLTKQRAIEQISYICDYFVRLIYQKDGFFPYYFYMLTNLKYQKTLPTENKTFSYKPKKNPFLKLLTLVIKGQEEGDIQSGNPQDYVIFFLASLHGLASLVIHNNIVITELPDYQILMRIFNGGENQ